MLCWTDKVDEWESGFPLKYPSNLKGRFLYETSRCSPDLEYSEIFIPDKVLDMSIYDFSSFRDKIEMTNDELVTHFSNLSNTSILIIPIPQGKEFTTIKEFIDLASPEHQVYFWRYVSKIIRNLWSKNVKFWVSTHGKGVPYFHLRLDMSPKYYQSQLKYT